MARPRKTGLQYFPFDVDFFSDEKVVCIGGEFGVKGELTIIRLLCAIYRNGYFISWNDNLKYKLKRDMDGVTGELLEQVVRTLVRRGFFDESLFNSDSILTSEGIQRRYFEATRLRKRGQDLPYLLGSILVSNEETSVSNEETRVYNNGNAINNNKLNEIKNDDRSSSKIIDGDDLLIQINEYKNKPIWINDMMRKFHISQEEICQKLDEYYLDMRCKEIKIQKLSGMFVSWLGSEIQKSKNGSKQQEDKFSRRRGIDPSAWKPEDFTDSF